MKGLSPDLKGFKLLNLLIPIRERFSELQPNTSLLCTICNVHQVESVKHYYFECEANREAEDTMLLLFRPYDHTMSETKALLCALTCEQLYEKPGIMILTCTLELIHKRRKQNKRTSKSDVKADLQCLGSLLSKARPRKLREAARMIHNQVDNFL